MPEFAELQGPFVNREAMVCGIGGICEAVSLKIILKIKRLKVFRTLTR